MYCNHCGKENPDGTKICTSCGLEIQRTEDAVIPPPAATKSNADIGEKLKNIDTDGIKAKVSEMKTKLDESGIDKKKIAMFGGIGAGALAVIIALIAIITSASSKVSLEKYMVEELMYTGINGYGSVDESVEMVNWEGLQNDIMKKKMKRSDYDDYYYYGSSDIRDYISIECTSENNGTLSNGDDVVYTFTVNNEGIRENPYFGKKISGGDTQEFKFEVAGLEEGTAINVFDAVDYVTYDTTRYNRLSVNLKDGYVMQYDKDGINVKVEDDYIRVYGDNFQSFSVNINSVSDNFDETSATIRYAVSCEADAYREYGIVLAPTEADIPMKTVSYVKDNTFSAEDLAVLTKKVKDARATDWDDMEGTLNCAKLFYNSENGEATLAYFFKCKEGFNVAYYDRLTQTNDGRICDLNELTPRVEGFFGYSVYKSVQDYAEAVNATNTYNIAL